LHRERWGDHDEKGCGEEDGDRKRAANRESIDTGTDKRFVRRGAAGKFRASDDVVKSLS